MGLRINNNIAALNSYNNVNRTDKAVSGSLEKLSSGYRINKAADDAAGLVVSEGLRSQIGGLTVASRNAQDGVNVVQTADGALGTVTTILQRMRDLAVQAGNTGTLDAKARTAAQTELGQLRSEIDRISDTTAFGGKKLLDGTFGLQPAKIAGGTQVDLSTVASTATNKTVSFITGATDGTAAVATSVKTDVDFTSAFGGTYTNDATGAADLQKALQSAIDATPAAKGKLSANVTFDALTSKASVSFSAVTADGTAADKLTIAAPAGGAATALSILGFTPAGSANVDLTANATADSTLFGYGTATASGTSATFQVGAYGTAADKIQVNIGAVDAASLNLSSIDLVTGANADAALTAIDAALSKVSDQRANLGAVQNRFEYTISNLSVSIENITASESAIRDTDMAAEMTKFTKNQILSQAGTSMLAQANSSTQNILTLLRG